MGEMGAVGRKNIPPARVAMMKMKIFGLRLKRSVSFCLSSVLVAPSSRR